MRVIFAGTPDFSVPVMQTLMDSAHEVVAVYTQPDRPAGRGRKLTASPVKQLALQHDIPVLQPRSLRSASEQAQLKALQPDLMVVVAYGLILPQEVLDTPSLGCVNLHASLLPRWRGAAPIQRAIQAGDTETGVCLMQMEAGLDSGPVLAQIATAISEQETGGSLHDRLSALAAQLLGAHLDDLQARRLQPRAQDESRVSYAHKLDKSEARLDWTRPSDELERQVRAFNPWPVASTGFDGESLRVWRARSVAGVSGLPPGSVVQATRDGIEVACGQGRLRLQEVQMPGARRLPVADFLNARSVEGALFS